MLYCRWLRFVFTRVINGTWWGCWHFAASIADTQDASLLQPATRQWKNIHGTTCWTKTRSSIMQPMQSKYARYHFLFKLFLKIFWETIHLYCRHFSSSDVRSAAMSYRLGTITILSRWYLTHSFAATKMCILSSQTSVDDTMHDVRWAHDIKRVSLKVQLYRESAWLAILRRRQAAYEHSELSVSVSPFLRSKLPQMSSNRYHAHTWRWRDVR